MSYTAISYVRWSNTSQASGDSLRRQTDAAEAYAASRGLTISTSLTDSGLSAFRGKNLQDGALGDLVDAVRAGHVVPGTVLIVESLDRISRQSPEKALQLLLSLINAGIEIVTLFDKASYKSSDKDITFRLMGAIMVFGRAHEESATKAARLAQAWANKHKQAQSGKLLTKAIPSWMVLVDGKIELIPERVTIIRDIYTKILSGEGSNKIAKQLNNDGIKTFGGYAELWTAANLTRIINHPAMYGDLVSTHNGTVVQDYYPAVFTREEASLLKTIRSTRVLKNVAGNTTKNWLAGLMTCSCGAKMLRKSEKNYVCRDRYNHGYDRCPSIGIKFGDLDYPIAAVFSGWLIAGINPILDANNGGDDLAALEAERSELEFVIMQVRDKSRFISRLNDISIQIEKIIRDRDNRLVPMQYSVDELKKHCNNYMITRDKDDRTKHLMMARDHLIRVVDKMVLHAPTYYTPGYDRFFRVVDIYGSDGGMVSVKIDTKPSGLNGSATIGKIRGGDNRYKEREYVLPVIG